MFRRMAAFCVDRQLDHGRKYGEGADALSGRSRYRDGRRSSASDSSASGSASFRWSRPSALLRISLANDYLFAQTSYAMVHAFDAESGRLLWSAQLGERTGFARGVAANSYAVVVTNADNFFALDKKTGRSIWKYDLGTIPTSSAGLRRRTGHGRLDFGHALRV